MDKSPILFEIAEWVRECVEKGSSDWEVVQAHIEARLQQLAPEDVVALHLQSALVLGSSSLPGIEQN